MLSFSWEVIARTVPVSLVARPDKPTTFPGHHGDFDRSLLQKKLEKDGAQPGTEEFAVVVAVVVVDVVNPAVVVVVVEAPEVLINISDSD